MKHIFLTLRLSSVLVLGLVAISLVSCGPVDLNAPMPTFETGVDPDSWAQIPAGEFHFGQHEDVENTEAYEIMVTNVTVNQYADYLNAALADGSVKIDGLGNRRFLCRRHFPGVRARGRDQSRRLDFHPIG